ncbi:translocation/assembly module TamB domain-containing protein [Gemmatimonadota bacterium]
MARTSPWRGAGSSLRGGAIDNPGLDIRASRRARDGVVAGLDIRGTLRRPEITLFSEPAMMQSEALAYIVLGRSLGSASMSEGSRVADAAASLGLKGGNILAGKIGQRFGLEEVRIEAEGPLEEASLVAGKYLSPQLYVSYGVGLFEPVSLFRMRYLLSSRWTLQAESGKAAGADLLYRIERGR